MLSRWPGGDIGIYLYGSTGGNGDELKKSTSGGAGVIERFTYMLSSSGEYAFGNKGSWSGAVSITGEFE